jgi:hypothetical protein
LSIARVLIAASRAAAADASSAEIAKEFDGLKAEIDALKRKLGVHDGE